MTTGADQTGQRPSSEAAEDRNTTDGTTATGDGTAAAAVFRGGRGSQQHTLLQQSTVDALQRPSSEAAEDRNRPVRDQPTSAGRAAAVFRGGRGSQPARVRVWVSDAPGSGRLPRRPRIATRGKRCAWRYVAVQRPSSEAAEDRNIVVVADCSGCLRRQQRPSSEAAEDRNTHLGCVSPERNTRQRPSSEAAEDRNE